MRKLVITLLILAAFGFATPTASAGPVLFEGAINQDGAIFNPLSGAPFNWILGGFDLGTGLGTATATVTGAGAHNVLFYLDIEIDEVSNTFFNEFGATSGAPGAGLSWEIDEPGFVFGDIYANFMAGGLDGTNGVPAGSPDDVSFALGWAFTLAAGETATLTWHVAEDAPGGFYLVQTDPDSPSSVYFWSDLVIDDGGTTVPDAGSTLLLLGMGLAACSRLRRRG
jgi:hypothetical protein